MDLIAIFYINDEYDTSSIMVRSNFIAVFYINDEYYTGGIMIRWNFR